MPGSDGLSAAFAHRGVGVIRELEGGHRNRVFLVDRDGTRLVAKTTRHGEPALRWLLPVLCAARTAGLAPPDLIADGEGRLAPGGLTLEPFVDGRTATPGEMRAIAPRIARIHARMAGRTPRPGRSLTRVPTAHLLALRRVSARLPSARKTVVHGDLNPSNLLMTSTGPALIDWDEARLDHPAFDLPLVAPPPAIRRARRLSEIATGWTIEPGYARALARRRAQIA